MGHWTPAEIPDLTGRIALVTGANSGVGFHTTVELARHGARILMACRNPDRAADALERLVAAVPWARGAVEVVQLDLASLESVEDAAAEIADRTAAVDILVNNAGVLASSARRTADGFELQLGTNHIGHFALTGRLLPLLFASDAPRVVTVSSITHRSAQAVWGMAEGAFSAGADIDVQAGRTGRGVAYGRSKLANLMFARELDRRAKAAGVPLMSVAAHPGYSASELLVKSAYTSRFGVTARMSGVVMRVTAQSPAVGAWPSLYGATDRHLVGGEYIGPRGIGELRGAPAPARMSRAARDEVAAAGLWRQSVSVTGVGYEELAAGRTA